MATTMKEMTVNEWLHTVYGDEGAEKIHLYQMARQLVLTARELLGVEEARFMLQRSIVRYLEAAE